MPHLPLGEPYWEVTWMLLLLILKASSNPEKLNDFTQITNKTNSGTNGPCFSSSVPYRGYLLGPACSLHIHMTQGPYRPPEASPGFLVVPGTPCSLSHQAESLSYYFITVASHLRRLITSVCSAPTAGGTQAPFLGPLPKPSKNSLT